MRTFVDYDGKTYAVFWSGTLDLDDLLEKVEKASKLK